jgi:tetratricopeptide (TPR) repeat protein
MVFRTLTTISALGLLLTVVISFGLSPNLNSASAAEFESMAAIDLGRQVDIGALYQEVNATNKVDAHNDKEIKWLLDTSSRADRALVNSTGRVVVGSRAKFDPSSKAKMDRELNVTLDAVSKTLLNKTKYGISKEEREHAIISAVYYSGDNIVNARTWSRCGDIQVDKGDYNGSIYYYQKAIKIDPTLADPQNNMGVALSHLGKYQEAISAYEKAINLTGSNSTAWNNMGVALYSMRIRDKALDCFNRSLQVDQGNSVALYNKGVIFSEIGRYGSALELYNRSIEADPYHPEAWNNKGVAQAKLGRYDDAKTCFQSAATLNQKYVEAMINGGIVLQKQGFQAQAADIFVLVKKLGYNRTEDYYLAQMLTPILMNKSAGMLPEIGWDILIATFIGIRWLWFRRKSY